MPGRVPLGFPGRTSPLKRAATVRLPARTAGTLTRAARQRNDRLARAGSPARRTYALAHWRRTKAAASRASSSAVPNNRRQMQAAATISGMALPKASTTIQRS